MKFQREKRIDNIRQYMGFHHVEDGAPKRLPLNFIKIITTVLLRQLAARAPRVMFTTTNRRLRPTAVAFAEVVNQVPEEINLQRTLRKIVMEAMFTVGIAKVGLYTVGECLNEEWGELFVDCITFDDLVLDMTARDWSNLQYIGNDYWADYEKLKENKRYKAHTSDIEPDEYTSLNEDGGERAEHIAQDGNAVAYRERVRMRDLWLPGEGKVVSYAVTSKKRLDEVDWEGPEMGPYLKLGYDDVPGNLLPVAPVSGWRDIHDSENILLRKVLKQAEDEKTVYAFAGGNTEAVEAYKAARDGDAINYTGPQPSRMATAGVNTTTLGLVLQLKALLSWAAGNIDALGGLGPQSDTLGQDRLIVQTASAQTSDMAAAVIDFAKDLFKSIAFYEWNNPLSKRMIKRKIPGTSIDIIIPWDKRYKKGSLEDFNLKVDVFSMQDNSPSTQLNKLAMMLQQFVLPMQPAIEAQNGVIDVQAILQKAARLSDFGDLEDIVVFMEQSSQPEGAAASPAPPATPRPAARQPQRSSEDQVMAALIAQGGRNQVGQGQ